MGLYSLDQLALPFWLNSDLYSRMVTGLLSDRRLEKSFHVSRCAWSYNLKTWDVCEPRLGLSAELQNQRSVTSCTSDGHWNLTFSTKHVTSLAAWLTILSMAMTENPWRSYRHWTKSCHGCSAAAWDSSFRNRTIHEHVLDQILRAFQQSSKSPPRTPTFSHQEYIFIATHFLQT